MNYLVIFNIYIFSKSTRFLLGTGLRVNKVDKVDLPGYGPSTKVEKVGFTGVMVFLRW